MASDEIHKQEFQIRDLTTRSVLLFPARAQITRDIKEITLHPGSNQIVIDGLAPTVDEHSIKVEGTGSATITDVSVDFLPNREIYEDIYPSEEDDDDDDEDESDDSESEPEELVAATKKIKKLRVSLFKEQEIINSAATRLNICDKFGTSVSKERPPPSDLEKIVSAYNGERAKIYNDHESSTKALEEIKEDIEKAEKEKEKLSKAWTKTVEKKEKVKAKAKNKNLRKKEEIAKEKRRLRAERESFWPKKVYRVTINIEPSSFTPGSSRRSSIDGDTIINVATTTFHEQPTTPLKYAEIHLSLSYISYSAFWSPRYDLSLNTVKCSGLLEYGAEIKNTTSETWKDAKVVLSTSQTNFSGLSEKIPTIHPWHVRLIRTHNGAGADTALMSQSELQAKQKEWSSAVDQAQKPRSEIFGRDANFSNSWKYRQAVKSEGKMRKMSARQQPQPVPGNQPQSSAFGTSSLFGQGQTAVTSSSGLFGGAVAKVAQRGDRFDSGLSHERQRQVYSTSTAEEEDEDQYDADGDSGNDDGPGNNSLTFEAGAWEESGMTTTYDVPGLKTLPPSNSAIKHKIAKVEFKNISFSHIVIGKLRQVAFLKARLRNTSRITLLRGPLGLTLDGSFLGQATFPRCSAGETFSLPLGVDPAIQITYPKPTVQRSQSGLFSKEDSNIFARSVVVMNTKPNAPCEITVLDQVPVSEDERLRIEVITPAGLRSEGGSVRTGINAVDNSQSSSVDLGKGSSKDARASVYGGSGKDAASKWGTAIATAKKGGEICWNVKLNPGQGVKLVLEYQATFPSGEIVVGVPGQN